MAEMRTIRRLSSKIEAALAGGLGWENVPEELKEKQQELDLAMTNDSKLFFSIADAIERMSTFEITWTIISAPVGAVAASFVYAALKLHQQHIWDDLEFQASDLSAVPDATYKDWAELFVDELYDRGYTEASHKFDRWKEEH